VVTVQIIPNAPRDEVVGWVGDRLKLKIKAPAVDGKANSELRRFVADWLDIRPVLVTILRGKSARIKTLQIDGIEEHLLLAKAPRHCSFQTIRRDR
jgi:uncharacterized protein (TIGR00251 family)